MNLFEIPAQMEREKDLEYWLVERTTPRGQRIQYRVRGKEQAAIYAASIGGILIGPEVKNEKRQ